MEKLKNNIPSIIQMTIGTVLLIISMTYLSDTSFLSGVILLVMSTLTFSLDTNVYIQLANLLLIVPCIRILVSSVIHTNLEEGFLITLIAATAFIPAVLNVAKLEKSITRLETSLTLNVAVLAFSIIAFIDLISNSAIHLSSKLTEVDFIRYTNIVNEDYEGLRNFGAIRASQIGFQEPIIVLVFISFIIIFSIIMILTANTNIYSSIVQLVLAVAAEYQIVYMPSYVNYREITTGSWSNIPILMIVEIVMLEVMSIVFTSKIIKSEDEQIKTKVENKEVYIKVTEIKEDNLSGTDDDKEKFIDNKSISYNIEYQEDEYEHTVVMMKDSKDEQQAYLEKLEENGWELENSGNGLMFLKRKI